MKKQEVTSQMKGQDKIPENQIKEVETGDLPEKECRIMTVNMIQDLGKRKEANTETMKEMFTKNLKGNKGNKKHIRYTENS